MITARTATLLTVAIVALTGCQTSADAPNADKASAPDSSQSTTPQKSTTATPATESSGYVSRTAVDGTQSYYESKLVGRPHWAVYQTGAGIDPETEAEIGSKAETFMREHVTRVDRWTGEWLVKPGELDELADKTTPALAKKVTAAVTAYQDLQDTNGRDWSTWSKKALRNADRAHSTLGHLMILEADSPDGGTDAFVYKVTYRAMFRGSSENGWKGATVGQPITLHKVNLTQAPSTETLKYTVWQAWKQVKGEWVVFDSGWTRV